ncbi:MAG: alpha/beta hydrolase-fold protein [Blastocatellia bacterium]|nr:alpha/beta hydrolase-fold protein [Blastocatellia bacterium]
MKRKQLFYAICVLISLMATASAQNYFTGSRLTIKSEVLGEEREVLVRTPEGYERDEQRYPVLYMTDGAAQFAHTISTIEFLWRNGRIPEMIVVAINNTDRTRDLTPTRAVMKREEGGEPIQFPTSGGGDRFLKFIETELIPGIEGRYRTHPYRIFAGHSFGGLLSLHAFLTRTELFNAYIAVSPSMHWDNQLLCRQAEVFFKDRKELNKTLFLTIADEKGDMRGGFDRFKTILAKNKPKGFLWDSMVMEDEDHGTVVLRSHYHALRKIFDGWQIPGEIARRGVEPTEEHYRKLSARFGFPVLVPEQLMNNMGYALIAEGKMDEAIKVFQANVRNYPNSANVYDSLGEAFEKQGKLDQARENYALAAQRGEPKKDPNLAVYKANLERVESRLKKER